MCHRRPDTRSGAGWVTGVEGARGPSARLESERAREIRAIVYSPHRRRRVRVRGRR